MITENYKLFATLCEGIVLETSTLSQILPKSPVSDQLLQYLHRNQDLGADQSYKKIQSINWSDIKDSAYGYWIIIKFNNGLGAIKVLPRKQGYTVLGASNESGEIQTDSVSRGDAALSFFKQLGLKKVEELYQGRDEGRTSDIKSKRYKIQSQLKSQSTSSVTQLVQKFRPLFLKNLQLAKADIKGMISTMVQNDAFNKANEKIQRVEIIDDLINSLQSGEAVSYGTKDYITQAVNTAVILAASYFYPEETGEINRRYGNISPQYHDGINKVLSDIGQGDQKKLAAVLGFFKRQIISG